VIKSQSVHQSSHANKKNTKKLGVVITLLGKGGELIQSISSSLESLLDGLDLRIDVSHKEGRLDHHCIVGLNHCKVQVAHLGISARLAGFDRSLPVKLGEVLYYCADQTIRASLGVLRECRVVLQITGTDTNMDTDEKGIDQDTGINRSARDGTKTKLETIIDETDWKQRHVMRRTGSE
jgi:hypothetical protein